MLARNRAGDLTIRALLEETVPQLAESERISVREMIQAEYQNSVSQLVVPPLGDLSRYPSRIRVVHGLLKP